MLLFHFLKERNIAAIRVDCFFVNQRKNVQRFHRNQIKNGLVINKVDFVPFYALLGVFFLLNDFIFRYRGQNLILILNKNEQCRISQPQR